MSVNMRATEPGRLSWEVASTWALRKHYSNNMGTVTLKDIGVTLPGRRGHAVCNQDITVYADEAFITYGFSPLDLRKPRPMCRRCERILAESL